MTKPKIDLLVAGKFAVGDRIAIYGFSADDARQVLRRNIEQIKDDGLIETDAGEFVHPKQCRKLAKYPRKSIWVKIDEKRAGWIIPAHKQPKRCGHDDPTWCSESCYDPAFKEFREVKKK